MAVRRRRFGHDDKGQFAAGRAARRSDRRAFSLTGTMVAAGLCDSLGSAKRSQRASEKATAGNAELSAHRDVVVTTAINPAERGGLMRH
jgi:hypothetical protein